MIQYLYFSFLRKIETVVDHCKKEVQVCYSRKTCPALCAYGRSLLRLSKLCCVRTDDIEHVLFYHTCV